MESKTIMETYLDRIREEMNQQRLPKVLYTTKEVGVMLNVDAKTITKWVRDGKIDYVSTGKLYQFTMENVEDFIKKHTIRRKDIA